MARDAVMGAAALLIVGSTNASFAATHCTSTESIAFSCPVGASKTVSLCLTKADGRSAPQLAYRFGVVGAPELVFPASRPGSVERFRYAHYFRSQVDRTAVRFSNAGVDYAVFDDFEGDRKPSREQGVRVAVNGGDRVMRCGGAVVSNLQQLEPLLPCDAENAASSCR